MRQLVYILTCLTLSFAQGQSAKDLFQPSGVPITYLGIDFSHVKLIGEFASFNSAGIKDFSEIRNEYFPGWNNVILQEGDKYDLEEMLNKEDIRKYPKMLFDKNADTPLEQLEAYDNPNYTAQDIQKFVKEYNFEKEMDGIGILFFAESLNKYEEEGIFHFVAINLKTKEVLIQDRLKGKPGGFGLRNYWSRSIYNIMKDIKSKYYKIWKKKYS